MKDEKEQRATIFMNDKEIWSGAWWKVWRRVLVLVADHREDSPTIVIVLGEP